MNVVGQPGIGQVAHLVVADGHCQCAEIKELMSSALFLKYCKQEIVDGDPVGGPTHGLARQLSYFVATASSNRK
jgi:hypothetical protein